MTFVEPFLSGSTEVAALLVVLGIHATRIVLRLAESACGVDTHNIFCRPYTAIVVGLELRSRVGSVLLWSVITALAARIPDTSLWSPVSTSTADEDVAMPQPKRSRVARASPCVTTVAWLRQCGRTTAHCTIQNMEEKLGCKIPVTLSIEYHLNLQYYYLHVSRLLFTKMATSMLFRNVMHLRISIPLQCAYMFSTCTREVPLQRPGRHQHGFVAADEGHRGQAFSQCGVPFQGVSTRSCRKVRSPCVSL